MNDQTVNGKTKSAEWMPGVEDIYQVSLVGNTCMHHLFLGIYPASLAHAPYTPRKPASWYQNAFRGSGAQGW